MREGILGLLRPQGLARITRQGSLIVNELGLPIRSEGLIGLRPSSCYLGAWRRWRFSRPAIG